jgi:hypothetical protein
MYTRCLTLLGGFFLQILQDYTSKSVESICGHSTLLLLAGVGQYRLVGFFDEDKGRPLHNGRAGTNEGDLDIFDLAFPSPS